MAKGYLGETPVASLEGTPFEGYGPQEWALQYIGSYGQIDGAHHKLWVLDQVVRILKGTPVEVVLAKWEDGTQEYRYNTVKPPSAEYKAWVKEMKQIDPETGEAEYGYDEGIAP